MPGTLANVRSKIEQRRDLLIQADDLANLILMMQPSARRAHLTKTEFLHVCRIKSPRRSREANRNTPKDIEGVTRAAYAADDEYVRIRLLTSLRGVEVPTASCLLAWIYPTRFGVIDVRSWKVLHHFGCVTTRASGRGLAAVQWLDYLQIIRELAQSCGATPQLIDRWLYNYYEDLISMGLIER